MFGSPLKLKEGVLFNVGPVATSCTDTQPELVTAALPSPPPLHVTSVNVVVFVKVCPMVMFSAVAGPLHPVDMLR